MATDVLGRPVARRNAFRHCLAKAAIVLTVLLMTMGATATATMVAVGYGGTIITSPNGGAWTSVSGGSGAALFDIANDGTHWVAVGSGGTIIGSTAPNSTWYPQASGTTEWLSAVATDGSNWAAVGSNGIILTSYGPPGWTWSVAGSPTNYALRDIATNGTKWIAVGDNGVLLTSTGPPSWSWANVGTGINTATGLNSIAADGTNWVIAGANPNSGFILTSPNGNTWTGQTAPAGLNHVSTYGGKWAIAGDLGTVLTSTGPPWDWVGQASGTTQNLDAIASCDAGHMVAAGKFGELRGASAPNWTWAPQDSDTGQHLTALACTAPPLTCAPLTQNALTNATVSPTANGGTLPYSWSASNSTNPGPVTGTGISTAYATAGSHAITVTDSSTPPQTATCRAVISSGPLACAAPAYAANIGQMMSLNATGGTGNYTWAAPGSTNPGPARGGALTTSYSHSGPYNVTLTDSGPPATTATCTVTINAPPLTCLPATQTIAIGGTARLNATGGTRPYAWSAAGSSNPVLGNGTLSAQYGTGGTQTVSITDAANPPHSTHCTVEVTAAPLAPQQAGNSNPDVATWTPPGQAQAPSFPGTEGDPNAAAPREGRNTPAGLGAKPGDALPAVQVDSGQQAVWAHAVAVLPPAPVSIAATAAVAGVASLAAKGRLKFKLPFAALFTRLRQDKLLDHELRAEILAIVKEQPGIHFREMMRVVGREDGVVRHHLQVLVEGNLIHCHRTKGHARYFPPEIDDPKAMRSLVAMRSPLSRQVMMAILDHPGVTIEQVAESTQLQYDTVRTHIKKLRRADLVLAQRKEKAFHLFASGIALKTFAGNALPALHPPDANMARTPSGTGSRGQTGVPADRLRQES